MWWITVACVFEVLLFWLHERERETERENKSIFFSKLYDEMHKYEWEKDWYKKNMRERMMMSRPPWIVVRIPFDGDQMRKVFLFSLIGMQLIWCNSCVCVCGCGLGVGNKWEARILEGIYRG